MRELIQQNILDALAAPRGEHRRATRHLISLEPDAPGTCRRASPRTPASAWLLAPNPS